MADRKATNYGDPILAKALRRNMTTSEIILWQELRNRSLGLKFRRQHPIGPYVLDFFCHKLKLCIELDGDVHQSTEANMYDERRTAFLNSQGIRFSDIRMRSFLTILVAFWKVLSIMP